MGGINLSPITSFPIPSPGAAADPAAGQGTCSGAEQSERGEGERGGGRTVTRWKKGCCRASRTVILRDGSTVSSRLMRSFGASDHIHIQDRSATAAVTIQASLMTPEHNISYLQQCALGSLECIAKAHINTTCAG